MKILHFNITSFPQLPIPQRSNITSELAQSVFQGSKAIAFSELHFTDVFCKHLLCLDSGEMKPLCHWSVSLKVTLYNFVSNWPRILLGVPLPAHVVFNCTGHKDKRRNLPGRTGLPGCWEGRGSGAAKKVIPPTILCTKLPTI